MRASFPCGVALRAGAAALAVTLALAPRAHAQGDVSPVPLDAFGRGVESSAGDERAANRAPAPRLVVALLLDQYRDDYLDRFRPVFGKDGFLRLIGGGTRFRDCTIPYAATWTGPGHATWLSGASPAAHGIVANDWYDRREGRLVAAAGDPDVRSVGLPADERGEPASPRWMRAQTVADVLRARSRGASRVIGISDKARGAILPTGRRPTGAYWLDVATGRMQTSTWYAADLPQWVAAWNESFRPAFDQARREPWRRLLPDQAYLGTRAADPLDQFPHAVAAVGKDAGPSEIDLALHPAALEALFEFAEAAVDHEQLGQDAIPDLLVLSVSITDHVGHRYGPDSPEVLDLAHRTDSRLAAFLRFLDGKVGRGRWALSLTSDHGVASTASVAREFEVAPGDSAGGLSRKAIGAWVDRVLQAALPTASARGKVSRWARSVESGLITFDDSVLAVAGTTRAQVARVVTDSARTNPWLITGFTADELRSGRLSGTLARQFALSFDPDRCGDVVLVQRPFVWFGSNRSSHGTPYRYDTHVPLVFYGWGVRTGDVWTPVSTFDIAPTVAALLGVDAPAQSEGRVLDEAFSAPRAGVRR